MNKYFNEQRQHTLKYLVGYFTKHINGFRKCRILEIGCAEGGFLDAMWLIAIKAVGIELNYKRAMVGMVKNPELNIWEGDITDNHLTEVIFQFEGKFDLIILRDVIEHITDIVLAFENMERLLKPGGYLYITFPPKFSAFGGHQQNGKTILKYVPFIHILPVWVIKLLGKLFRDSVSEILNSKKHGITVQFFKRIYTQYNFKPIVKGLFLSRPIFKTRFGISIIRFPNIPGLRELALGCEYLLRRQNGNNY